MSELRKAYFHSLSKVWTLSFAFALLWPIKCHIVDLNASMCELYFSEIFFLLMSNKDAIYV